jgi:pimeloyl-ACP methyl ester carboxylesterase
VVQPRASGLRYGDLAMWTLKVFARPILVRLMGVPKGLPLSTADARFVSEMLDSIFPVAPRAEGVRFDAFVSNADVNDYDLEEIRVPTLIVHAKDDPLASHDAARRAADRIPGGHLISPESGGHLILVHNDAIRIALATFFDHALVGDRR